MEQGYKGRSNKFGKQIIDFCKHIAGSSAVTAIAMVQGNNNEKTLLQIVAIIHSFQPRVMSYIKKIDERTIFVLAVDQWVFERDIEKGFLGEATASKLIFPYLALSGKEYLYKREIALKKRLILEAIENLISSFPELAHHIQIKPEYFIYEIILSRIRVFPLLAYTISDLMDEGKLKNETKELQSYLQALNCLEKEQKITYTNGFVKIDEKFASSSRTPKIKLVNLSRNAPRTIFNSFFGVFPHLANVFSQNTEVLLKAQKINWTKQVNQYTPFINPQKYVFFETAYGLVSLAENLDIKGFAEKMLINKETDSFKIKPIGGILNDVYLIDAFIEGVEKKVLVKRFKDWSGFKWYPLNLWSFGARSFVVSGQARLAKECITSEFLSSKGFDVPEILHVSNAERLIFMEFIDGDNLTEAIKRIAMAGNDTRIKNELGTVSRYGEILARVHSLGYALGDTKPENTIVKPDGTIYLLDFEQASEKSDKSWDIAVFLYYCGHYLQSINSIMKAEDIAKSFISGYLKAGGDVNTVRKSGDNKYTRIFSIFTMPAIILAMSNACKKTEINR